MPTGEGVKSTLSSRSGRATASGAIAPEAVIPVRNAFGRVENRACNCVSEVELLHNPRVCLLYYGLLMRPRPRKGGSTHCPVIALATPCRPDEPNERRAQRRQMHAPFSLPYRLGRSRLLVVSLRGDLPVVGTSLDGLGCGGKRLSDL
jgi:hypothetical protein